MLKFQIVSRKYELQVNMSVCTPFLVEPVYISMNKFLGGYTYMYITCAFIYNMHVNF